MHAMTYSPREQRGSAILEALISILIFSVGILAITGLQAISIKNVAAAKYRTDASFLANQVIGQMWADDKSNQTLKTNYETGKPKYETWSANVIKALPGAATTPPTIKIDANNVATVTISWQEPGETLAHRYVALTRIDKN